MRTDKLKRTNWCSQRERQKNESNKLKNSDTSYRIWSRLLLRTAAVYNVLWGTWIVLFPAHFYLLADIPLPNYPGIWQGVGMIVGVFGVGYWIAGEDYRRFYPILLVGFLGKLFGPIGIVYHILFFGFPPEFLLISIPNDIIWLIPFGILVVDAVKWEMAPSRR